MDDLTDNVVMDDDDRMGWCYAMFRAQVDYAKIGHSEFVAAAIALGKQREDNDQRFFRRYGFYRFAMLTALARCSRFFPVLAENDLLSGPISDDLSAELKIICELRHADEHVEQAIKKVVPSGFEKRIEKNTKLEDVEIEHGGDLIRVVTDKTSDSGDLIGGLIRVDRIAWVIGELDIIARNAEGLRVRRIRADMAQ